MQVNKSTYRSVAIYSALFGTLVPRICFHFATVKHGSRPAHEVRLALISAFKNYMNKCITCSASRNKHKFVQLCAPFHQRTFLIKCASWVGFAKNDSYSYCVKFMRCLDACFLGGGGGRGSQDCRVAFIFHGGVHFKFINKTCEILKVTQKMHKHCKNADKN